MVDIADLKHFYRSSYGKVVFSEIKSILNVLAPNKNGTSRLYIGFGVPFAQENKLNFFLMPAHMGTFAFPSQEDNLTTLSYENNFPFSDQEFHGIVLIHGLEYSHSYSLLIEECYRCLKSDGELIVVVPNRRGVWAHSDNTPLGYGQPYTLTQLVKILSKGGFMVSGVKRGLYQLPLDGFLGKVVSKIFKYIGKRILQKFSGLVAVAAKKQVYSGVLVKNKVKLPKTVAVASQ